MSRAGTLEAMPGRVLRRRGWSVRVSPRALVACLVLAIAIVVLGTLSIAVGELPLTLPEVWRALLGSGEAQSEFVVHTLRLPRALTAILAGAAFGASGAIFQSLARNPLGSPDIIGFDSGAALGAVTVLVMTGGSTGEASVGAVIGGLATALAVYLLAWRRGVRIYRLVLIGLGLGFVLTAFVDLMITRADINDAHRAAVWLTGSLNGRGWDHVAVMALAITILTPFLAAVGGRLSLLELGDDLAAGLGLRVDRSKLYLAVIAVLLAAFAVAAVGPVAFVAFVSGPVARRVVSSPHAAVLPAAFVGAFFLVAADLVARRLLGPTALPVGIATAIVGAPYLIWLLTRQMRTGVL